jgi:uncharacterized cupredoxin-like copper-binding protein
MHQAVLLLAAASAHEKSKTAFYILGSVLVVWAVVVSVLSFQSADFPGSPQRSRAIMGISAVLVAGAIASAVITGSTPAAPPPYVHYKGPPKGTVPPPTVVGTGAVPVPAAPGTAAAAAPATTQAAASAPQISADPSGQLSFTQTNVTAKAGKVTITFTNSSPIAHNLTIASPSGLVGATPTFTGGTKTLTVTLKPGTYQFYCTVPGHRQAGMQGTLTVQ